MKSFLLMQLHELETAQRNNMMNKELVLIVQIQSQERTGEGQYFGDG